MSGRTWVYSDPHFYHQNICKFLNFDGSKVRPWDDANEMTKEMIQWYNDAVADGDRVYLLGDIAFTPGRFREVVGRLNGRKVLVPGNHEPKRFDKICSDLGVEIRGYVVKKGFIMSHIPIHEQSLSRWQLNIHGHLHGNTTKDMFAGHMLQSDDKRYYNACVERTNFRPKLLDEILHERGLK